MDTIVLTLLALFFFLENYVQCKKIICYFSLKLEGGVGWGAVIKWGEGGSLMEMGRKKI